MCEWLVGIVTVLLLGLLLRYKIIKASKKFK